MSFPGPKVHRLNRKKLGRGQYPAASSNRATVTGTGSTVTITFNFPVVVSGTINFTLAGRAITTQTITTPTVLTLLMNGTITGRAWQLPPHPDNVRSTTGGPIDGIGGTFA